MTLTVTVLGCSGTYAAAGNACSGYLVRSPNTTLWVDSGPGTLAALQEHVDLDDVDGLLLSHGHPDHWLELPVFRNALRYVMGRSGVPVYSPADVRRRASALIHEIEVTFDWHEVDSGDRVEVGDIAVEFSLTEHPVPTLAMRFSHDGRSLGYSADTGPGWSMAAFAEPVDTALWEATVPRGPAGPHTAATDTGRLAAAAGVGRLLLTHLLPGSDPAVHEQAAAESFHGPVEAVVVGRTYQV